MARNYAALPWEYLEEMDTLDDAEFGRLMRALIKYSMTGEPVAFSGNERFFAKRIMAQEDRYQESYNTVSQKNVENGKRGGRPRKNAANPEKPTETQPNPEKPTETQPNPEKPTETQKTETETKTKTETNTSISPPTPPRNEPAFPQWPKLSEAVKAWCAYKAEKRQGYKPTGYKSLLAQIQRHAGQYGEDAVVALIQECMASNWQGIVWDRLERRRSGGGGYQQPEQRWEDLAREMDARDARKGGGP